MAAWGEDLMAQNDKTAARETGGGLDSDAYFSAGSRSSKSSNSSKSSYESSKQTSL